MPCIVEPLKEIAEFLFLLPSQARFHLLPGSVPSSAEPGGRDGLAASPYRARNDSDALNYIQED